MDDNQPDGAAVANRHSLVLQILEIGAQQARCDRQQLLLKIERAHVLRDAGAAAASEAVTECVHALDRRLATLGDEARRLAQRRAFLIDALKTLGGGAPTSDPAGRS